MNNQLSKILSWSLGIVLLTASQLFAIDLQLLGGFYDQSLYVGYPTTGTFKIELSKDNYSFQPFQFEINISLPPQGAYDASRAAEAVIPAGWELIVNTSQSLILRATEPYVGTGAPANRRKDFILPVAISAASDDQPSNVTIQWNDPEVVETTAANSVSSVLNVANNPLPVTLTSFKASKEGQTSLLSWSTTEETNSDRFEIEHSVNGKSWEKIGSVKSKGESRDMEKYTFVDENPVNGGNLYRLKMIDRDDTFAYSQIQNVNFENIAGNALIFPNPATNLINVGVKDLSQIKSVKMFDLNGRATYSAEGQAIVKTIDISSFGTGTFVVEIAQKDGTLKTSKVSVIR